MAGKAEIEVYMKTIFLTLAIWFILTLSASAQTAVPNCPDGYICITPAAAKAALEAGDKAKALEAENKDLREKIIPDLKQLLADMRVQYAEAKGENTILKQRAVSDAALIELLSKMVRPKKIGVNLF